MQFYLKEIINRTLLLFFLLFILQITLFIILEDIFIYTIFSKPVFFYNFYAKNILFSGLTIFIILFFLNKKFNDAKFVINIKKLDLNKKIKIVIFITIFGIILSLFAKFLLYGEQLYERYIILKEIPLSCIFTSIRHFWLDNTNIISENSTKLFLYNTLSPLGTIFINSYYILIFLFLFFGSNLRKKLNLALILTITFQ